MKKKSLIFIVTICLCAFFMCEDVNATIDYTNTEIECIYANGVVAGLSYDAALKRVSAYIKDYPVQKTSVLDGDPITNISFFNMSHAVERLSTLTCPSEIRYWKAWEYSNPDEEEKTFRGVYSFDYCTTKAKNCVSTDPTITAALATTQTSGWWFWESTEATGGTVPATGTGLLNELNEGPEARIPLVAERLYIIGELKTNDYLVAYKSAPTEAIGSANYIQFLKQGSTYFVKKGKTLTSISSGRIIGNDYICFKESVSEQDSSRGSSEYKFNITRHQIATVVDDSAEEKTCNSGYSLYKLDDVVCSMEAETRRKSFCDEYGDTAAVLIRIIQIMQIVVPAIVIVLTGIEIGRIVLAGNLDEELPKRKKMIIVRFIIMLTFFFLPVIARLVTNLLVDQEIYDISCLFNNGVQDKGSDEGECVELNDEEESGD